VERPRGEAARAGGTIAARGRPAQLQKHDDVPEMLNVAFTVPPVWPELQVAPVT